MSGSGSARSTALVAGLIALVVAAFYARSAAFGFVYDDGVLFARQPVRGSLGELFAVLAEPHWMHLAYWRPLARFTLELQKALHGPQSALFHLANALLAGLAAAAAFAFVSRPTLGISRAVGALVALVFGLHPIVSSCTWPITGREALLATALSLVALALWLDGGAARRITAAGLVLFALGAREQAVALPVLFVLVDLAGLSAEGRPRSARAWIARHAPPFAALGLWALLRARVLAGASGPELALLEHPLGPLLSVAHALATSAAPPWELAYEPQLETWARPARLLPAALVLAPAAFLVARRARALGGRLTFLGLGALVALAPTANLWRQEAPFAERHVALALPFLLALVAAAAELSEARVRRAALVALALLGLVGAAESFARGAIFADDFAFLGRWSRTSPRSAQAHAAFGCVLFERGRASEAERELRRALELDAGFVDAHANLGAVLVARGAREEALPHLRLAVRARPDLAHYRLNLGVALFESGSYALAARHLERAAELLPESANAAYRLGLALEAQGEREAAREAYGRALARDPEHAQARRRLQALD